MKNKNYLHIVMFLIAFIISRRLGLPVAAVFIIAYAVIINYPNILFSRGAKMYAANNMAAANKNFEKAYKFFYTEAKLKISYSFYLLLQGELQRAETIIKEIGSKPISDADKLNLQINDSILRWKKNDLNAAIEILEKLEKNTMVFQNLGFFKLLTGDYEGALVYNLEAYDYNASNPGIMDNLAQNYFYLGNYEKAKELYTEILSKNPRFSTPYYYYASILVDENSISEAIEVLERALKCNFSYISYIKKDVIEEKIEKLKL